MEERALIRFSATEFQIWMLSPWFLEWPFSWELIITGVNSDNPIKTFIERSFAFELDVYHPMDDSFKLLYTADFYHFLRETTLRNTAAIEQPVHFFLSESGADSVPKLGIGYSLRYTFAAYEPAERALRRVQALSIRRPLRWSSVLPRVSLRPPQLRVTELETYLLLVFTWTISTRNHRCLRLFPCRRSQ